MKVASREKIGLQLVASPSTPTEASKWILMDLNQQNNLLLNVACPSCFQVGCIVLRKGGLASKGFSEPMYLQCTRWPFKSDPVHSSGSSEGVGFDVNLL